MMAFPVSSVRFLASYILRAFSNDAPYTGHRRGFGSVNRVGCDHWVECRSFIVEGVKRHGPREDTAPP